MFKSLKSKILGFLTGLALVGGLAFAANTFYVGYNPQTNQFGVGGLETYGGAPPVVTGTCGTIPAAVGGTSLGQVTTAAVTTCTLTFTLPVPTIVVSSGNNDGKNSVNSAAAPTGMFCQVFDLTHPAVEVIATVTATACTTAAMTITAGDVIQYSLQAY